MSSPGFVEIFQNCDIYNDGAFDFVREDKENRKYLKHGEVAGDAGTHHAETDLATVLAKGEGRRAKGEGRRAKGEGRRAKGEGRRAKGEGRRAKGEGRPAG
ncbi:MAG: hypothetical protein QOH16_2392, partial [Gaiellaceae bacterium]|nr:hypothetical protein [Gaiellaceae bacterium]